MGAERPNGSPSEMPGVTPSRLGPPLPRWHAGLRPERGDTDWSDPQLKLRLFTAVRTALPATAGRRHVSLLPAPPKCLFKPTHCSANWITFHVKIDLLKQQQRRQIKTAATAKVQSGGGLGRSERRTRGGT